MKQISIPCGVRKSLPLQTFHTQSGVTRPPLSEYGGGGVFSVEWRSHNEAKYHSTYRAYDENASTTAEVFMTRCVIKTEEFLSDDVKVALKALF